MAVSKSRENIFNSLNLELHCPRTLEFEIYRPHTDLDCASTLVSLSYVASLDTCIYKLGSVQIYGD